MLKRFGCFAVCGVAVLGLAVPARSSVIIDSTRQWGTYTIRSATVPVALHERVLRSPDVFLFFHSRTDVGVSPGESPRSDPVPFAPDLTPAAGAIGRPGCRDPAALNGNWTLARRFRRQPARTLPTRTNAIVVRHHGHVRSNVQLSIGN